MSLRERIASLMGRVRPELAELVAIRSVADPRQFPPEECARAAQWVLDAFAGAGFSDARLAEMADGSHAEVDGRWYGRGAADCKGNIVMHLTALRALGDQRVPRCCWRMWPRPSPTARGRIKSWPTRYSASRLRTARAFPPATPPSPWRSR